MEDQNKQNQGGFTLVELLIVIAIIGLLSSIVFASLNNARAKARDTRRLSDLKQIRLALELYYDSTGSYPSYQGACPGGWATASPSEVVCWNDLTTKLKPYLSSLPTEPLGNTYSQYHYRSQNGQNYCLLMVPEKLDPNQDEGCYGGSWYCVGNYNCGA